MRLIKKVWITPYGNNDLVVLSFESKYVENEFERLHFSEMLFPAKPSIKHPLRHTICVKVLDAEDLIIIRDAIDKHLESGGM